MRLYSIGHSTRPLEAFLELLRAHGVRALADVRTVPKSLRHPHFAGEALARSLGRERPPIEYLHMKALGGLRKPRKGSRNTGWRVEGFRGYADYMETPEFERALEALLKAAKEDGPLAFMCAEAVPWRCHRQVLSDALIVRGHEVLDITGPGEARPHKLTPFAVVEGTRLSYPPEQPDLL